MYSQKYKFNGRLKIGQHKLISVKVRLEISFYDDNDEWAELDPNIDLNEYIDGVKCKGELSFECYPLQIFDKHPVKQNTIAELTLVDSDESTMMNIMIMERISVVDVIKDKIKNYTWMFLPIGKPLWDKLSIFPGDYHGIKMNKIFTCVDFRGYWAVGVASVIIAPSRKEAKILLEQKLKEANIVVEDGYDFNLEEISIDKAGAVILNSGDWK